MSLNNFCLSLLFLGEASGTRGRAQPGLAVPHEALIEGVIGEIKSTARIGIVTRLRNTEKSTARIGCATWSVEAEEQGEFLGMARWN
jgi:hypothetical protein